MKDKMEYLRAYTLIKDADVYVYQPCEIKKYRLVSFRNTGMMF